MEMARPAAGFAPCLIGSAMSGSPEKSGTCLLHEKAKRYQCANLDKHSSSRRIPRLLEENLHFERQLDAPLRKIQGGDFRAFRLNALQL